MDVCVRQVRPGDAEGFRAAVHSVAQERRYLLLLEAPPTEKMAAFIRSNLENGYSHFVAVQDGAVVGWADITPLERPTLEHVGALGMGVLKAYRGRGVGTQLLSSVIDHAWKRGLKRLELEVFADNELAINLYKKHGYEVEGLKRYARLVDGDYQDIVVMAQYRV